MRDELAALAADAIACTRKPWEYLLLRATVLADRMDHRLTSGPSEEHVRCKHPPALRTLTPDVVLEMRIERDGTFEALVTNGINQYTGYLPPSYTLVREPRPRDLFEPYERTEVVGDGPLAHVETELGVRIPAEAHDLHLSGRTKVGRYELVPADQILPLWQQMLATERRLAGDPRRWAGLVRRSLRYPDVVRPFMFHPLWVPILRDPGYYGRVCVDLAPGPNGHIGQLVHSGLLVAHSAADLLTDPTPLELSYTTPVLMTVHDPSPAELEALPENLHELTVVATDALDLTAADLSPLDQLTHVELRGARIALPPLPQVRELRAAEADVDLTRLPAGVEYLVLNVEQWQRCDARPAAARLVGERSLARALDWAESLGVTLPRQVISGTAAPARL